jgi:hypothetical protein
MSMRTDKTLITASFEKASKNTEIVALKMRISMLEDELEEQKSFNSIDLSQCSSQESSGNKLDNTSPENSFQEA